MGKTAIHRRDFNPDEVRMTFGEHLEELRGRLIKGLVGVLLGVGLCLYFVNHVFMFIIRPLRVVLISQGQSPDLVVMNPPEVFVQYIKVAVICGLMVSGPWLIWQLWLFVAAGLFPHEQKFARMFAPASMVLFVVGVSFMFYVVLPVVLNFLTAFTRHIPNPSITPTWIERQIIGDSGIPPQTTQPAPLEGWPVRTVDPPAEKLEPGQAWIRQPENELRIVGLDGKIYTIQMRRLQERSAVFPQYRLMEYISFVLSLMLAFGIAFQLPIVVVFLVLLRIFDVADLARARKYVIFSIFVASALLTPPDIASQLLLALPMILLFELGLLVSRLIEWRRKEEEVT